MLVLTPHLTMMMHLRQYLLPFHLYYWCNYHYKRPFHPHCSHLYYCCLCYCSIDFGMLADRSWSMYLAHFHQLTNHRQGAADSPLLFAFVAVAVYCVMMRAADVHVQLIEWFANGRDRIPRNPIWCWPVAQMWLTSAVYFHLINWMLLKSSFQLRDFPLTMSHKLAMLRSKNYSLGLAHLWPIDSVGLAAMKEIKRLHLLMMVPF